MFYVQRAKCSGGRDLAVYHKVIKLDGPASSCFDLTGLTALTGYSAHLLLFLTVGGLGKGTIKNPSSFDY